MRDFTPDSLDRLLIVIFPKQRYRPFRKPHGARTISGVFAPLFAQFMTADTLHHTPLVILRISLNLSGGLMPRSAPRAHVAVEVVSA